MITFFSWEKKLWDTYRPIIQSINNLEDQLTTLSENEIKEKFNNLRRKVNKEKSLTNDIIINSFAITREVSKRTLQLRHYDTQLLGGLILNEGKIIEMQTGEGKTLVATLPAVTNALTKKGVHIITVNDYLAKRDTEWIGQIYRFLDVSVGLIDDNFSTGQKKNNYSCDITYLTNNALGFDFLRDALVSQTNDIVQRPFNYCIIDEVDSVLIDEAKTPLIISKPEKANLNKFVKANNLVNFLENIKDFEIDEKTRNISLTEIGFELSKNLLKIENLYQTDNPFDSDNPWIYYILNALKAKYLYFENIHYVLINEEIVIVDESTGRLMFGRKWGEGLHQAIEIKEGLTTVEGIQTIASTTYQSLFRLYPKLSGMTGTAKTEELEFETTYNLAVVGIPTFKPVKRIDLPDLIYPDEISKWTALAKDVAKNQKSGRPVLIGTPTIANSDLLSNLLNTYGIKHELLNARPENVKRESEIIAQAGRFKSVTLATNMAGRGTDILLGGNPEFHAKTQLKAIVNLLIEKNQFTNQYNFKEKSIFQKLLLKIKTNYLVQLVIISNNFDLFFEFLTRPSPKIKKFDQLIYLIYIFLYKRSKQLCEKEAKKIKKLGGLYVIGTERHDSRRIDNQLRGRAGRQGDPGTSRFYLSPTDNLIRLFGGPEISEILQMFQLNQEPLESKLVSKFITSAQQKVEGINYDQRKNVNKYDDSLEKQHFFILNLRKMILESSNLSYFTTSLLEGLIDDLIDYIKILNLDNENKKKIFKIPPKIYFLLININLTISSFYPILNNIKELKNFLYQQSWTTYNTKETEFWSYDENFFHEYQKLIFLQNIDFYWAKHLINMDFIKQAVMWESYAQKDPFLAYLEKAEYLFNLTLKDIRDFSLCEILSIEIKDV